jgi:hypothetical protein
MRSNKRCCTTRSRHAIEFDQRRPNQSGSHWKNVLGSRKLLEAGRRTIPDLVVLAPDGAEVFASDAYTVEQLVGAINDASAAQPAIRTQQTIVSNFPSFLFSICSFTIPRTRARSPLLAKLNQFKPHSTLDTRHSTLPPWFLCRSWTKSNH